MRCKAMAMAMVLAMLAGGPAKAAQDGVPALDHVFLVVMENHAYDQIIGNPDAPFLNRLAREHASATRYNGVWHPSLPNYLALLAGDRFGVADDLASAYNEPPGPHRLDAPTLGSQLVGSGRDWRAYLGGLPAAGSMVPGAPGDSEHGSVYAVKHNPFAYFTIHQTLAERQKMLPLERLAADLAAGSVPALAFIVPDQCHDMHGMGNPASPCHGWSGGQLVAAGDEAVRGLVEAIVASPGWRHGNNLILVVWDEGKGPIGNDPVPAIAVSSGAAGPLEDPTPYDHYALLKTLEAGFGLSYLGHAADPATRTMAAMLAGLH